jgi:hypothetical protein
VPSHGPGEHPTLDLTPEAYQVVHGVALGDVLAGYGTGFPAPQEVYEAMVVLRDQDRHHFRDVDARDGPVHLVLPRDRGEGRAELVPLQSETFSLSPTA